MSGVAVTPSGSLAISASHDWTLKVWDLELDGLVYYAEFSSLGRTTPGTIQLISPKGDVLSMACRSATESFAIWEGRELEYETEL